MVTFGGTGMLRLRRLLTLHGYATNTHLINETKDLLKPYAKMELKLISRLIQRGVEDETEEDIFSSVKKLLNHGQLEPIPFGQMVNSNEAFLRLIYFQTFAEIVRCWEIMEESSFLSPKSIQFSPFWFVPPSFTFSTKNKSKSEVVPKIPLPPFYDILFIRGKRFRLRFRSSISLYYFPPTRKFYTDLFLLFNDQIFMVSSFSSFAKIFVNKNSAPPWKKSVPPLGQFLKISLTTGLNW